MPKQPNNPIFLNRFPGNKITFLTLLPEIRLSLGVIIPSPSPAPHALFIKRNPLPQLHASVI